MFIVLTTGAALTILGLLFWVLRGTSIARELPSLHRVDILAFRNLLSEADEQYLRISLSETNYRQIRRGRVRAAQQYLLWIAEDCTVLLALLRAAPLQLSQDFKGMALRAVQMRLISLSLWAALWIEYLFPRVEIRPQRALGKYEEFWRLAEKHLARSQPQPALSPGRG